MAATNYTPISLYYSTTASTAPTAGNLVNGELAINITDGVLYYKDNAGAVQKLATKGGVGTSSTTQVLYNSSGLVVGSANMVFSGTVLTLANDASISGLTVGKGGGASAFNAAFGNGALAANTAGLGVVAVGYHAAYTSTGNNYVAIGNQALGAATTGDSIIAIGALSLNSNSGNYNTAIGHQSLTSNTTASNNTAVGYQAGYSGTTAAGNTYVGWSAGLGVTTGAQNTLIGYGAGTTITTGNYNVLVGSYNGNQNGLDIRTASNYIVLSDGAGNVLAYVQNAVNNWYQKSNSTLWSITSDARIKKNVVSLESGLNVISALRPVEFDYIENDKHDIGFIAQEYQTVLPAQISEGENGMLSLNQNLVPYLVSAIQELKAEIDQLKGK